MENNIICIPFAYESDMNSGVNLFTGGKRLETYMKNVCVALLSAKHFNPECTVALVTNLKSSEIPEEFNKVLDSALIQRIHVPFDSFRFDKRYTWSLAFYKLCALKSIANMGFDKLCYLDADVYIQGSLDAVWRECSQNILLYDINHGLNTEGYAILCDEVKSFFAENKLVTHYGGEFFASASEAAREFVREAENVYKEMIERSFVTTRGDEFILSLAAYRLRASVKNAGAYIYRFWTGVRFRLVSTCYRYNRVTVLHVPREKERGMLKLYDRYIRKGAIPSDRVVWRTLRLSGIPLADYAKKAIVKFSK